LTEEIKAVKKPLKFWYLVFVLATGLFLSCGDWGWENIQSDQEPTLNVFGMIIIGDGSQSFVQVQQTLELQGSDYRFAEYDTIYYGPDSTTDIYVYEIYKTAYLVEDATVFISDGRDTTYFYYTPPDEYNPEEGKSRYLDTLNQFQPLPNTTYYLSVSTPDGRMVTGSVTTPPIPYIYSGQVPDTLYNKKTFTIPFKRIREGNYLRIKTHSLYYAWRCGSSRSSFIPDVEDTTWTSKVINCSDEWWGQSGEPDSMIIELEAMEENYYQYFIKQSGSEYVNLFLGNEGNSGASSGVSGGYGVFGAISYTSIKRVYFP